MLAHVRREPFELHRPFFNRHRLLPFFSPRPLVDVPFVARTSPVARLFAPGVVFVGGLPVLRFSTDFKSSSSMAYARPTFIAANRPSQINVWTRATDTPKRAATCVVLSSCPMRQI